MQRNQRFLTRYDVSRLLSISPASVDRLRRAGRLRGFLVKRRRLFTFEEVEAFITQEATQSTEEVRNATKD